MVISNVHVRTLTEFLEIVMVIVFSSDLLATWVTQAIYIQDQRSTKVMACNCNRKSELGYHLRSLTTNNVKSIRSSFRTVTV